jgi:hypothetical protein
MAVAKAGRVSLLTRDVLEARALCVRGRWAAHEGYGET